MDWVQIAVSILSGLAVCIPAIDGRLLYLDEKRSRPILAGMSAAYPQRAIQAVDFEKNIRHFWDNVKWEQSKKCEKFFGGSGEEKTAFARACEEAQKKQGKPPAEQRLSD